MAEQERDLVLPPQTYAHIQDTTKGSVSVCSGPYVQPRGANEQLMVWKPDESRFFPVSRVDDAMSPFVRATEGEYVILLNPAVNEEQPHPPSGTKAMAVDLAVGRKVNLKGPAAFALWPGQSAETLRGHHLRHNQYVLVRVTNAEEAERNEPTTAPQLHVEGEEPKEKDKHKRNKEPYRIGQLRVITGTETSFYIPQTGVEVVPDPETGERVRDAVTLERMEWAVLLDENGNKRFVQGPDVVFPKPTEKFVLNADGEPKAEKLSLNTQSGVYVKVIADYLNDSEHELETWRGGEMVKIKVGDLIREGDELFITGKHTPIYSPRPEDTIITYRGQRRHQAEAISRGEGLYVLHRPTGVIELVKGPKMFLADPRTQIIVQRILDPATIRVWYPGNEEALQVNQDLAERELQVENIIANQVMASEQSMMAASAMPPPGQVSGASYYMGSTALESAASAEQIMRSSSGGRRGKGKPPKPETTARKPRTIVLNNKYRGAVGINPYSGFAVLVTDKTGRRRVMQGPTNILLEYDETLGLLSLSTGTPKTDQRVIRTPYLRIINNRVTDEVEVETKDLVRLKLRVSYRVNFEGDPERWFNEENYVRLLCDQARSRLRNLAKTKEVQDFYDNAIDLIRDCLLGTTSAEKASRPGLLFEENGMRLFEVEVHDVEIQHHEVSQLMQQATWNALTSAIRLSERQREAKTQEQLHRIERDLVDLTEQTEAKKTEAVLQQIGRTESTALAQIDSELHALQERGEIESIELLRERAREEQVLELTRAANTVEETHAKALTDEQLRLMGGLQTDLAEAIRLLGDETMMAAVLESLGPVALALNSSVAEVFARTFDGSPVGKMMDVLAQRPHGFAAVGAGNGSQE